MRPEGWPTVASRRVRSVVARGSMPYSAVTQPRPWPFSQGGSRSSRLAVHSTCVLPNLIRQEPSACIDTARSMETRRSSSGLRLDGRIGLLLTLDVAGLRAPYASALRPSNRKSSLLFDGAGVFDPRFCTAERPKHQRMSKDIPLSRPILDREPVRAAEAQRALAHHLPADRRDLSGHRRAGRLAQSVARPADGAVAGLDPQRHVGPGAPGLHLRAPHLGRPPADRDGLAHVRRRPARARRPDRRRAPPDRGADRHQARAVAGAGADRSRRDDLRPLALRRRRAHRQAGEQDQAHRVRAAGARQGPGGAGRRRPARREPRHRPAAGPHPVEPVGGRQLPQRARARPHARRSQGAHRSRSLPPPRPSSTR